MIPKTIHYCWFGGAELPNSVKKCIESWKTQMPDATIVQWNESNYDVNKYRYTKEAYEAKKYAFVSDVARLEIIFENGGIYLDTDVELIKPLDKLLHNKCYFGFQSQSSDGCYYVNTGIGFAAEKGTNILKKMIEEYKIISFVKEDGTYDTLSCPVRNSKVLVTEGLELNNQNQIIGETRIYPADFFCPISEVTGKKEITEQTYSIHHFSASWADSKRKLKSKIRKIIGIKMWNRIKRILHS